MKKLFVSLSVLSFISVFGQLKVGAERTNLYFPILQHKRVALIVNQTSNIKNEHLVDSLLNYGINVVKVFAPEHGFRGHNDAGQHVANQIDKKTNLPIISLYGKNKKPSVQQLEDVDIVVFDIQDVGVRFYTYISTMHYVMEACAENHKDILILDRPNPNGFYVAGPILDTDFKSFVGMHPIPIVHGLTVCELAKMINNEGWLKNKVKARLTIIPCENYTHNYRYRLPIKPSPNLPNQQSILLYPSLCLFEGTKISIGRGSNTPFQVMGSPDLKGKYEFHFTPKPSIGASRPKLNGEKCFGVDLTQVPTPKFSVKYVTQLFSQSPDGFFTSPSFFDKLAGTDQIRKGILAGKTYYEIEKSWSQDLQEYLTLRKQYLLYPDFD